MNLKLDNKTTISRTTQGVGAVGGVMASKVAMSFAPAILNKPLSKIVFGIAFIVAPALVKGKGAGADLLKGAGYGAGSIQLAEGVAGLLKPTVEKMQEGKVKEIAQKSMYGLAGADSELIELPAASMERRPQPVSKNTGTFAPA
ncbi:hypothetical protein [Polaribacter aestuariivivens]|uniref:hypothetical protein n=1 Tax=Polaribacter aestuariivivens TaxID=2304626 RepID=UPI003F4907BC